MGDKGKKKSPESVKPAAPIKPAAAAAASAPRPSGAHNPKVHMDDLGTYSWFSSMHKLGKHAHVWPVIGITGIAAGICAAYVFRLATASPEVAWRRHSNPEPFNVYADKQYKFVNIAGHDYKRGHDPERPVFDYNPASVKPGSHDDDSHHEKKD